MKSDKELIILGLKSQVKELEGRLRTFMSKGLFENIPEMNNLYLELIETKQRLSQLDNEYMNPECPF